MLQRYSWSRRLSRQIITILPGALAKPRLSWPFPAKLSREKPVMSKRFLAKTVRAIFSKAFWFRFLVVYGVKPPFQFDYAWLRRRTADADAALT